MRGKDRPQIREWILESGMRPHIENGEWDPSPNPLTDHPNHLLLQAAGEDTMGLPKFPRGPRLVVAPLVVPLEPSEKPPGAIICDRVAVRFR